MYTAWSSIPSSIFHTLKSLLEDKLTDFKVNK